MKNDLNSNWIVTMECKIRKEVTCESCTVDEAWSNPWDYATDEREIEQLGWTVTDVKETT